MIDLSQLGALPVDEKRELLKNLLSLQPGNVTGGIPLSFGQQALWFIYQLAPESPAYNFLYAGRIHTSLDLNLFRRACSALVERHPLLRTRFIVQEHKPIQQVDPKPIINIPVTDASTWSEDHLLQELQKRADLPFQLERAPCLRIELFQRSPEESVLLLVFPHIIADLWSADLLLQELQQLYTSLRGDLSLKLPPVSARYADFVRWQMVQAYGEPGQKSRNYWHNLLGGELPVLSLPTDRPRPPVQTYNGTAHSWPLKSEATRQLRALARQQGSTPFILLLAVFQLLLHRLSGQEDILVGAAVAGRDRPEWERVVGYFLNQVVFRTNFSNNRSFRQLLDESRDQVYQALEHQAYPFGLLVKQLQPKRDPARSPIFQVMFIWDKPRKMAESEETAGADRQQLRIEPLLMEQRGAPFDLTLIVFELGEKLVASFRYNSDLFDSATIQRWAGHLDTLLEEVIHNPDVLLSEVPILSPPERQQILVEWNQTETACPASCFPELFEQQVRRTPSAVAISFEEVALSYDEVNRRANQLARYFQTRGVRRGDTVALRLSRSPELILTLLAVWKVGAAYLFLDPMYPSKRRDDVLAESRPVVVIGSPEGADSSASVSVESEQGTLPIPTISLDKVWADVQQQSDRDLCVPLSGEDRAYIIYTSGSTGQPKGAVLRHGGLSNLLTAQQQSLRLGPRDRVLQFASLSFDASVWEIVAALGCGSTLYLGNQSSLLPGPPLWEFLRDKSITCITLPPSILAMLPTEPLPALRTLIVAGEACSAELVETWAPGRRFLNAYGPTEVTICATIAECPPNGPPTIGRPIANTRVYVLDQYLQPAGVGVAGELYVAGPGLALGYLNKPDLTAERFLPNPFDEIPEHGGERTLPESWRGVMYRTGDIVRWTVNGELEFLGRLDHQVKIRGYRIELEEIQSVLRRSADVLDAVVLVRKDQQKSPTLVAYVIPRSRADFSLSGLRTHLRERLPHYMLPGAIVPLDTFPLNPTGKLDRARLPGPAMVGVNHEANGKPHTPLEQTLARIWSRVLSVDRVGVHDNFFDLGGASTQALEVVTLARERGLQLSPEMLFRYQTIADLAAACDNGSSGGQYEVNGQSQTTPALVATHSSPAPRPPLLTTPGAVVESIGVYLPEQSVTTDEVLKGCRNKIDFPLERLTGIRSRRVAGEKEFSIDLAEKAVAECLRRSTCLPGEIDLVICCNISRCDGPMYRFSLEPTSAARICRRFGLVNALAFDLTNACAGTFTAIMIIDAFLRQGIIKRGMVVSGEYITHLSRTAQQEIESYMDSRLPCLTLGDSGVALLLEKAPSADVGFQEVELYTLGKYHDLCVAKLSSLPGSGPIMHTDSVTSTTVTIKQAVSHAVEVLQRRQWDLDQVDALIIHQTSETTLDGAVREINRAVGKNVCHRGNTIYNVAERGNTATNTHFLAVWEKIQAGNFQAGDRAVFAVSGSGQTVGTGLYIFDDLPDRLRQAPPPQKPSETTSAAEPLRHFRCQRRVRIESIGALELPVDQAAETVAMLRQAGEACLRQSARSRQDIDLVLHTGVYRSEFLSEPAVAAIAAGTLGINHDASAPGRRTLGFDVLNSAAGTLTACFLASGLIGAHKFTRALLLASEVDHNRHYWPENPIGLLETASAMLLEESPGNEGFAAFAFRAFPEYADAIVSYTGPHENRPAVFHHRDQGLESQVVECVCQSVREFLARESIPQHVVRLVSPQRPKGLGPRLAEFLGIELDRVMTLEGDVDYFTSSLAYVFQKMRQEGGLAAGTPVVLIEIAAGLQVWCALYYA